MLVNFPHITIFKSSEYNSTPSLFQTVICEKFPSHNFMFVNFPHITTKTARAVQNVQFLALLMAI